MQSVADDIDFGSGLTLATYEARIQAAREKLQAYNRILSMVDGAYNDLIAAEKELMDFSERMLSGFGVRYGKDSSEYEMAGGQRKSEYRKRTHRSTDDANVA
ncbi:hypothetical protein [Halomicronema hongdechloris]|nr:hypothetical protein [Halomicronema hongdechloris]